MDSTIIMKDTIKKIINLFHSHSYQKQASKISSTSKFLQILRKMINFDPDDFFPQIAKISQNENRKKSKNIVLVMSM